LKLEFPASLKYCREFSCGAFDGRERPAAYTLSEVQGYLREMDGVAGVPWVLLSAGVGPREFALNLELASQAGASGFLAGRAVWWGALGAYPDMEGVRRRLEQSSLPYLEQISALASLATPWTAHKRYNDGLTLEGAGPDWYSEYQSGY
ncbi:MAG: hypothetical protein M3511_15775, partial [Deinococcota bacterium]|nr:hypothetical protein [Deinococcota bacterium]